MNIRIGSEYPKPRGLSFQAFERLIRHLQTEEQQLLRRKEYRCLADDYDGQTVHLTLGHLVKINYVFGAEPQLKRDGSRLLHSIFIKNAERDLARVRRRNALSLDEPLAREPAASSAQEPLAAALREVASPAEVVAAMVRERVDRVTAQAWVWCKLEGMTWEEVVARLPEITPDVPQSTALRKRAERLMKNKALMRRVAARILSEEALPPEPAEPPTPRRSKLSKKKEKIRQDSPDAACNHIPCCFVTTEFHRLSTAFCSACVFRCFAPRNAAPKNFLLNAM